MQHDVSEYVRVKLARAPSAPATAESFGSLASMSRTPAAHIGKFSVFTKMHTTGTDYSGVPQTVMDDTQTVRNSPSALHFVAHHPDQITPLNLSARTGSRSILLQDRSRKPYENQTRRAFDRTLTDQRDNEEIDHVNSGQALVRRLVGIPQRQDGDEPTVFFKSHKKAQLAALLTGGHVESVAFSPKRVASLIKMTNMWHPTGYSADAGPEDFIYDTRSGAPSPNYRDLESRRVNSVKILGSHPVFGEYITAPEGLNYTSSLGESLWLDRETHRYAIIHSISSLNHLASKADMTKHYGDPPRHFDPSLLDDAGREIHAQVLANPGDHLARAVLADHLDNMGHHEHADNWRQTLPLKFAKKKSTPQEVPILTPELGINVNDKHQAFTEQILNGAKTIETRNASTLHPYVGKKMGLVRTGKGKAMLVGYVTIGEPKLYTAQSSFDKDFDSHLVGKDSPFHISKSKKGSKWGYALSDVEKIEPRLLKDGTGVAPNPRVARKLQNAASPVRYSSAQDDVPSSTLPSDKQPSASFGSTKDWVTKNDPHSIWLNERHTTLGEQRNVGPVRHRSHDDAQPSAVHFVTGHPAQMSPISAVDLSAGRHGISVLGIRRGISGSHRTYLSETSSYLPVGVSTLGFSGDPSQEFQAEGERDLITRVHLGATEANRNALEELGAKSPIVSGSGFDMRDFFTPLFKERGSAERLARKINGYVHTVHIDPSRLRGRKSLLGMRTYGGSLYPEVPSNDRFQMIDQRDSGKVPSELRQSIVTLAKHPEYGEYILAHNMHHLVKSPFFQRSNHFAGSLNKLERFGSSIPGAPSRSSTYAKWWSDQASKSHITPLISQYWRNLIDLHSDYHNDPWNDNYNLPRVLSADALGGDHTPPTHQLIDSMGDDARHLYAMALADHSEPAPRIVLADLFDEHGHEGAANFMRASVPHQASGQVKLAKDPSAKPSVARGEIAPETQSAGDVQEMPPMRIGARLRVGATVPAFGEQQAQPVQQQFPAPPAPLRHPEISARIPFAGNQSMLEPGDIIHTYYTNKDNHGNPVHSPMHLTPRMFREFSEDGRIMRSHAINEDGTAQMPLFAAPATGDESPSFAIVQRAADTISRAAAGHPHLAEPEAQPSQPAAALPQSNVTADHFRHWNISHTQSQLTPEQIADAHFNVGDDVHIRRDNGRMDTGAYRRINLTPSGDIEHVVDLGGTSGDVTVSPEDVWHWSGASSTHPAFRSPSNWDQINSEIKDKTPGRRIWVNTGFRDKGMKYPAPEFLNQYRRATLVGTVSLDGTMSVRLDGGKDAINVSSDRVRDNTDQSYPHVDRFDGSPISVIDTAGGAIYHGVYRGMARQRQDGQSVREAIAEAGLPYGENWTDPSRGPERFVHVAEINTPDGPLPIVVEREDILPRFAQGVTHNELNEDPRSAKAMLLKIASLFEEQGLDPNSVVSMRERAAELGTRPVRAVKPPVIESSTKAVPDNKLERIISNSGERNYQDVADSMRDKFREIFGKYVDDETIMDILRVPRAFPGADPNHPAFSPENIELDAAIYSDNVGSRVKSKLPNYKFSASTTVGLNKASNNSQHHGGVKITHDKFISTPHILQNQANAAHSLGIKKLGVSAALDNPVIDPHNGYTGGIVWPTYGYTKDLNEISDWDEYTLGEAIEIARRNNPSLHAVDDDDLTLNHLLDSKEGIDWYTRNEPHKNGGKYYPNATSGYMQFHTDPSSDSHRILARKTRRLEQNAASRKNPS